MTAAKILTLDLASRTGWAISEYTTDHADLVSSGFYDCDGASGDTGWGQKLGSFDTWISKQLNNPERPDVVVVEQPQQYRSRDAARVCWGLYTLVRMACFDFGPCKPVEVPGGTLKKWATGSGKAKKPAMVKAAQRYVPGVKDHNEADAILLAAYAREVLKL